MGIHGIGPTMGLPMTLTIVMTMALAAMTLTWGLGIWVALALLYKIARLATIAACGS